ncbi:MAG: PTS sugar transporter subunit IIA [Chromatiales bacterium]|nr:PTS sugar transporter subunit IIA [Chromatiales bacterium]
MNLDRQAPASRQRRRRSRRRAARSACSSRPGCCSRTTRASPAAMVFDSLFAREKLGSTGLGQGIAIPHGRIKGLQGGASAPSSAWPRRSSSTRRTASRSALLFVLLVPEQATEQHLQILSELAQMFSDKAFRDSAAAARPTPTAIHALFADWAAACASRRASRSCSSDNRRSACSSDLDRGLAASANRVHDRVPTAGTAGRPASATST